MSYIYDLTDTWNAAGTVFTSIKMNVTDSASASGSKLIDLQLAGTSFFNVDKSGNVGIGSSSPSYKLDVRGVSASIVGSGTNFRAVRTSDFYYMDIAADGISAFTNTNGNAPIIFKTSTTERMRITAAGDVGIGTTAPGQKFDVVNAGDVSIRARNSNSGIGAYAQILLETSNSFNALSQAYVRGVSLNGGNADIALTFGTSSGTGASSEKMRIDASGNLGLGVTPKAWQVFPVNAMQIGGAMAVSGYTASGNRQANIWCNAYLNTSGALTYMNTDAASAYRQLTGVHAWYSAPSGTADTALTFTQTMTLDASGNLGLSLTPSAWGTNYKAVQAVRANLYGAATYGWYGVLFNAYSDNTNFIYQSTNRAGEYRFDVSTGAHAWFNAPSGTAGNNVTFTQAMTLDASGRLMIGATSAQGRLYVANGSGKGFEFYPEDSSATNLLMNYDRVGGVYQNLQIRAATHQWAIGATERARIDSSGNLLVGTTSTVGTANVVATNGINSKVVTVGANATVTTSVPDGCICIISQAGFSADGAIFAIKSTGGSQAAAVIAQNSTGYGFGTTTDPNTGTRTDLWISSANTLSIKDKTSTSRNFMLTFISAGL